MLLHAFVANEVDTSKCKGFRDLAFQVGGPSGNLLHLEGTQENGFMFGEHAIQNEQIIITLVLVGPISKYNTIDGQIHEAKPDFTKIAADVASMPAEIEQSRKALTDIAGGDHAGAQVLATFTHAWWQHVGNIPVRLGDRLALEVTETMHTIKEVEYKYQY